MNEPEKTAPPETKSQAISSLRVDELTLMEKAGGAKLPHWFNREKPFFRLLRRAVNDAKFMEAVESLRDAILRSTLNREAEKGGLIIALAGPRGGEGTSLISLLLSLSLGACVHRKIAYLDGRFNEKRFEALSNVLELTKNEFTVVKGVSKVWGCYNHKQPNTYFLNSLGIEEGLDFFSDKQLGGFLETLRHCFDITVIDMPPLIRNTSNVFLAPAVDQLYLTVAAGKTPLSDVQKCTEIAAEQGASIRGVIVNHQAVPILCRLFFKDYFI